MKPSITLMLALLGLLPITAHAICDSYMNSQHGLSLPATISVPDSLPVGGLITQQPFGGTVPGRFMNCSTGTRISVIGRYRRPPGPSNLSFPTEVPGVGMRITITDARPSTNFFDMTGFSYVLPSGRHPIFTGAQAYFYKTGPITDGVVPAGNIYGYVMHHPDGSIAGHFQMLLNNPVRFISPAATCQLAAGDAHRTISLDPVNVSALQNATTANARDFELTANCSHASGVTFRFSGTPAPGNDRIFANTGTAGGVALWLYSRIDGGIQNILANGTENTRTVVVSGNRAVLPLGAAYHKNGTVSPGTLASVVTVSITYN